MTFTELRHCPHCHETSHEDPCPFCGYPTNDPADLEGREDR